MVEESIRGLSVEEWRSKVREMEEDFEAWRKLRGDRKSSVAEKSAAAAVCCRHVWRLLKLRLPLDRGGDEDANGYGVPFVMRENIISLFDDLSNGVMPLLIEDAARQPGRPLKSHEKRQIAYALFYLDRVRQGAIADRRFMQTVREAYGVTAKTVRKWEERRHEICRGVPGFSLPNERLVEMMRQAGQIYRRAGRGAAGDL